MNVMITRAADECPGTVNLFLKAGFAPYCLPMIETVPLTARFRQAAYDIGLFTSAAAVKHFARLKEGVALGAYIATGPATAERIRLILGAGEVRVPEEYSAEGIKAMLADADLKGKQILSPGALERSTDLGPFFKSKGASYEEAPLYRTEPLRRSGEEVTAFIRAYQIETVCFFSASAVRAFFAESTLPEGVKAAAIGKPSARAVRDCGVEPLVAPRATTEGFLELLAGA